MPTEIQKQSIGFALQGKDILGAAKTGSGKTLAFLVPILEHLFCQKWTRLDGLGALIISPTRELAYQIFETLRKVGVHHDFSAGLIIGGQNLKFERKRMDQCNIMICTPGRLLQHMDENPLFNCSNMQILVLDEADRCLDLGFEAAMNSIIENLPNKRQTLLFSATQTKSVRDLARLSLSQPTYVAPHEQSESSTPVALQQNYVICEVHEKISILWSFIKNHLKQKSIVFMASCKQVKYVYEIFCKLRPGISLLALYGSLHQERREQIYKEFCRKSNVVLFATDLASRGLDFPLVNWVVQVDCPEDGNTYIHRVGRTARGLQGKGEGFLMLLPSEEEAMLLELKSKKIPINKIHIDPSKLMSPQRKMESFLAEFSELKQTAQRAFVSYAKSVFLMKNKNIFNIYALDTDAFAKSLGLVVPPRIRFLQKMKKNIEAQKQINRSEGHVSNVSEENFKKSMKIRDESDDDNNDNYEDESQTKGDSGFKFDISDDDDEDILTVKRRNHNVFDEVNDQSVEIEERPIKKKKSLTKAAIAKKLLNKKIVANTKVVFNEEGEALLNEKRDLRSELAKEYENEDKGGIDIEKAKLVLREEDRFDKERFREKIRLKHKEEKRKLKQSKEEGEKDDFGSESESDGPDMSWLPDPDKVYGERNSDDDESPQNSSLEGNDRSNEDEDDNVSEEKIHRYIKYCIEFTYLMIINVYIN